MNSLLFNYMDEMLFRFCTDGLLIVRVEITGKIDREAHKFTCKAFGCQFDRSKHVQVSLSLRLKF